MEEDESELKVARWLSKLPFVIRNNRGAGQGIEVGNINFGLDIESEGQSIEHERYLHVTSTEESNIEEFNSRREHCFADGHTGETEWQRPTIAEQRIHLNQQAIAALEANRRALPTSETLDIEALKLWDTTNTRIYTRGLEMNEFSEDDIQYISWKRVIMKRRGLIAISVLLIIFVIIAMGILIGLVKHDHIPSHESTG